MTHPLFSIKSRPSLLCLSSASWPVFFFFFFFWVFKKNCEVGVFGYHPQENLAKSCYTHKRKVEKFRNGGFFYFKGSLSRHITKWNFPSTQPGVGCFVFSSCSCDFSHCVYHEGQKINRKQKIKILSVLTNLCQLTPFEKRGPSEKAKILCSDLL